MTWRAVAAKKRRSKELIIFASDLTGGVGQSEIWTGEKAGRIGLVHIIVQRLRRRESCNWQE
jgi:hypothetical protein